MERFEDKLLRKKAAEERERRATYRETIEDLALRASYMPRVQSLVRDAISKIDAVMTLRFELKRIMPEILEIPEPEVAAAENEFVLAKQIVDLLWKEPAK